MDEISIEKNVKEKDRKISFRIYDSDESSSPWLILSSNNNNYNDANLDTSFSTQNMEKEATCCNHFPTRKKKILRDQLHQHIESEDKVNIHETSDGHAAKHEQKMDANDKEISLKAGDTEFGTDDDNNNDNNNTSFENSSYISEDENLGVIDDIILLPNNLYSEDEMSNSDDCIYAYRGVDFEPIRSSTEDENDFLEMDFEPDPSSEIEQDSRSLRKRDGSENGVARESNLPTRLQPDLASDDVQIKPNISCNLLNTPNSDRDIENADNGDDACPFKSLCTETHIESCDCLIKLNAAPKNGADEANGKEDRGAEGGNNPQSGACLSKITSSSPLSLTTAGSAPHAMIKYTGTIPKTNRNYLNLRLTRSKVLSTTLGSTKIYRDITLKNYPSYMCKKWKIANSVPDTVNYQKCDESQNASDSVQACQDPARIKSNTKRSMSFPFEGFIHSEEQSNNETQVVPTRNLAGPKLQSSQSQNQLFKQDEHEANVLKFSRNCHGNVYSASVTISTSNCDIDVISAALVRSHFLQMLLFIYYIYKKLIRYHFQAELNIRVNLRKLATSLSHITDIELIQLSISEYLIHMSKLNCDYKAIKNAIISSHDDLDLEIDFIGVSQAWRYYFLFDCCFFIT